jgi:hypothetical protein
MMKTVSILFLILTAALFAASPGDIVVNEIMFNGPESGTDNEWVELYNITIGPIHLDSTWTLTDGEGTFDFAPINIMGGSYLTIEVNENSTVPFPFTPDIDATGFGIALGNSSDDIVLLEGTTVIDSVTYDDAWGADGDGPSLERIDPLGPSNSSSNWGPSTVDAGTPGAENTLHGADVDFPPTVEDIAHSPGYPTPTDDVTVTATITDDGIITKALLFYNVDDGVTDSTTFADDGAHGDGAADDDTWGGFISTTPVGSTVRYYLVVEDDSLHSDTSWTYAYFVTSGDTIDGDLVINEIMFNPQYPRNDSYFEFIEFYNRGTSDIIASGWFIKDNSEFNTFMLPLGGVTVAAGGYLVVAKNADSIEANYPVTDVVGGMSFSLNNDGDAVRLYNGDGDLVDYVVFTDTDPWPETPDGDGPSLELIDPTFDNYLASSWQASAGDGTPGASNSTNIDESGVRPVDFALMTISPNPFNAKAKISIELPRDEAITLSAFDIDGRLVDEIFSGQMSAGIYKFALTLEKAPSGVYLIKMQTGGKTLTKRALLVK